MEKKETKKNLAEKMLKFLVELYEDQEQLKITYELVKKEVKK